MKVHHLNCCTMRPWGGRLVTGVGGVLEAARLVAHCLLVELDDGLVLVDSGVGTADVADPKPRLGGAFCHVVRPALDREETAVRQVERLGHSPSDVRHVVLTHLDVDHAGGLADFPQARVHVHAAEQRAAMARATHQERSRYRPAHWAHGPRWELYEDAGEPWHGLAAVRPLRGLPPEIALVPLIGHTRGHSAVAVRTGDGWLLHAGDAYFHRREVDPDQPACTPVLRLFQRLVEMDRPARLHNQERLRELVREHGGEVRVFSAHDPVELDGFAG